jgi:wobble nucleotide-excising tRNase
MKVKGKTNEKGEKCVSRVNTGRGENDIISEGEVWNIIFSLYFLNTLYRSRIEPA